MWTLWDFISDVEYVNITTKTNSDWKTYCIWITWTAHTFISSRHLIIWNDAIPSRLIYTKKSIWFIPKCVGDAVSNDGNAFYFLSFSGSFNLSFFFFIKFQNYNFVPGTFLSHLFNYRHTIRQFRQNTRLVYVQLSTQKYI